MPGQAGTIRLGQRVVFRFGIYLVGRLIQLLETPWWIRSGGAQRAREGRRGGEIADITIAVEGRRLVGAFACSGAAGAASGAAVLLLHGIGDRLEYWVQVQLWLARRGVPSLVFHTSGFPPSTGVITPENVFADAVAAYGWMRGQVPAETKIFLLGFSLGTGLAAEAMQSLEPPVAGLILCEAYTSLRAGAERLIAPLGALAGLLPDIWRTVDAVRQVRGPVMVVHSDGDLLFSVEMAQAIYAAARGREGQPSELLLTHGYQHNATYNLVAADTWEPILSFILRHAGAGASEAMDARTA